MRTQKLLFAFIFIFLQVFSLLAQNDEPPARFWSFMDPVKDKVPGIDLQGAYDLLKGRKGETVVVAVIDGGIDVDHEDLKSVMWINEDEIPENGVDDDNNGYVDDIHGWNFMGASNGDTYYYDQGEATQIYVMWKNKYEEVNPDRLDAKAKREYYTYSEAKQEFLVERSKALEKLVILADSSSFFSGFQQIGNSLPEEAYSRASIQDLDLGPDFHLNAIKRLVLDVNPDRFRSFAELSLYMQSAFGRIKNYFQDQLTYSLNPDYRPRSITGDDPADPDERYYGGPTMHAVPGTIAGRDITFHGTHVAGIIGADRTNDFGAEGVADHVRLMMLGAVPSSGDERDKDVANSIRYAVDNGAKIINMSFGKKYSPHKEAVDAAVRYAEENDVLICHLSHNYNTDIDSIPYYPVAFYEDGTKASNYMRIGNSTWHMDHNLPAFSSNYGKISVDVFAPGTQIYSTYPNDEYGPLTGTSMATPTAAGLAALIRSYFPSLTAEQTKEIIRETVWKPNFKVRLPGTADHRVDFSSLCNTGGIINAKEAVKKALSLEK